MFISEAKNGVARNGCSSRAPVVNSRGGEGSVKTSCDGGGLLAPPSSGVRKG